VRELCPSEKVIAVIGFLAGVLVVSVVGIYVLDRWIDSIPPADLNNPTLYTSQTVGYQWSCFNPMPYMVGISCILFLVIFRKELFNRFKKNE
jgi:hypothetical protein